MSLTIGRDKRNKKDADVNVHPFGNLGLAEPFEHEGLVYIKTSRGEAMLLGNYYTRTKGEDGEWHDVSSCPNFSMKSIGNHCHFDKDQNVHTLHLGFNLEHSYAHYACH